MARIPKLSRPAVMWVALATVIAIGAGALVARQAAASVGPLEGHAVSVAELRALNHASSSCPMLTPARLAGQVMAVSHFGATPVDGMSEAGAAGTAALTAEQWQRYAPWPGADPSDPEAGIAALARAMCQIIGRSRAVRTTDDPWHVALATHRAGLDAVVTAGAVPEAARDYVDTVRRYTEWYEMQPAFGGTTPPVDSLPGDPPVMVPVPENLVGAVLLAGGVCPDMSPARIAAQVSALSGFDPSRLGPANEQGIAQFLPHVWSANVNPDLKISPWEPDAAIRALGATMCNLIQQSGGRYDAALAAFTRADSEAAVPRLVAAVTALQAEYAADPRLEQDS